MNGPIIYAPPGAVFIAELPAGAKMISVGPLIMVVAPNMPPCWVTPAGLVPIDMVPTAKGASK